MPVTAIFKNDLHLWNRVIIFKQIKCWACVFFFIVNPEISEVFVSVSKSKQKRMRIKRRQKLKMKKKRKKQEAKA
jgi:hypothetical protein